MNEKIKEWLHQHYVIITYAILVLCFVGAFACGVRNGTRATDNNNISSTVQDIKGAAATAGNNIADAQSQIGNARASIDKASAAIRDSRAGAEEVQRGINECQALLDECISINRQSQTILDEIGNSNRGTTEKSKNR